MNAPTEQGAIERVKVVKSPIVQAKWIAERSIHSNAIAPRAIWARSARETTVRTAAVDRVAVLAVIAAVAAADSEEVAVEDFEVAVAGAKGVSGAIP